MTRIAAVLLALAVSAPATAQESFRVSGLSRGQVLSIRDRPDAGADLAGSLPWNARRIRGFGCTSDTPSGHTWCRVKHGGVVGWSRRRYLQPE